MQIPTAATHALLVMFASGMLATCTPRQEAQAPPGPKVSVARPLQQTVVDWYDFVGRFEASREVEVRARASGYIQSVHFRDGQRVRAGQLLFLLDPRPAQAQLDIARSQNALAQADLRRAKALLSADAISKEEFDSRRAAATQASATQRARSLDVEFTRVTAPISGLMSDRRVDPGNLIEGGTSAGDVLTTIIAADPIYFYFNASEALLLTHQRAARSGRKPTVRIRLLDESDYRWEGWLDFTDNALDADSGTIRLRAILLNRRGFLRPGMIGHARLEGASRYPALLVPDAAIVTDGARKLVYVVAANDQVQSKLVSLGPLSGELRVIRSGLSANDRVIVSGAQRARPGMPVTARLVRLSPSAPKPQAPSIMPEPASVATPAPGAPPRRAASTQQPPGSAPAGRSNGAAGR